MRRVRGGVEQLRVGGEMVAFVLVGRGRDPRRRGGEHVGVDGEPRRRLRAAGLHPRGVPAVRVDRPVAARVLMRSREEIAVAAVASLHEPGGGPRIALVCRERTVGQQGRARARFVGIQDGRQTVSARADSPTADSRLSKLFNAPARLGRKAGLSAACSAVERDRLLGGGHRVGAPADLAVAVAEVVQRPRQVGRVGGVGRGLLPAERDGLLGGGDRVGAPAHLAVADAEVVSAAARSGR